MDLLWASITVNDKISSYKLKIGRNYPSKKGKANKANMA